MGSWGVGELGSWGDGEMGSSHRGRFLHLGRESGIGNRESEPTPNPSQEGNGNRNPPLTPPRRGRAGNGENYPVIVYFDTDF